MPFRWCLLALFAVAFSAGCGKKGSTLKTYPVTGTVTYNSKPVAGATVAYVSKSVEAPRSTGVTEPDGRFSISTYVGPAEVLRGVPPGDYQVTIVKMASSGQGAATDSSSMESMTDAQRQEAMSKMWQQQRGGNADGTRPTEEKPKSEIPAKYGRPETSGLSATVVVGENPPKDLVLTDD
ncbi:MAG TPA: carboxypeptidase-like regulatory domain-containing protein [Pirellulales bacterium]|jgi:hypothetical protein|nr:carboxypeptidase-like regulatory domain-containing protein [Pirellulales bacterium]